MAEKQKGFDLAAALGSVSNLDTGIEGREQLKYLDIELVQPDPDNFYSMDGLDDLAGNIELIGLQQPLRVRPDPENEGKYIIVSGHRRRAALSILVGEGKDDFRLIPCLIEGRQESAAMRKLRLIFANSSTRMLSPADMAQQAKDVEDLLYQLQEEGTEFPGRMRDHVAEACQVSKSRLARLKVIREGLTDPWKGHFEDGSLVESSAYELARLSPEIQKLTYEALTKDGKTKIKDIPTWRYSGLADVVKDLRGTHCDKNGDGKCERVDVRVETAIKDSRWADCARCCANCYKLATCKKSCAPCREIAQKKAEEAAAKKAREAQEAKEREAEEEAQREIGRKAWVRLGNAIKTANVPLDSLMELWVYSPDEDDVAEVKHRFAGETLDGNGIWMMDDHPLQSLGVEELVDLADKLGVSLDFLFCRTDEPRQVQEITKEVREWRSRGETPPTDKTIVVYAMTNDGPKYTPAVWDGFRFHAPGDPKKELTGLAQQFTRWTLLPGDE